jgi:hypothetical protein
MSAGYHLVDITYTENKIRIAFYHSICDGRGIKPFVETLIYYYCCDRYQKNFDSTGIRLAGEPLLPGETQEPIGSETYEFNPKNLPEVTRDGYALPENNGAVTGYYRHVINVNKQQLMLYAKTNHATPGSMYLPYSPETAKLPISEQAALYRKIITEQRSPDLIKCAVNGQIGLFEKLDQHDTLAAKQQMMSFFNNLCINTYVISYLGQMEYARCTEYVESTHLYSIGNKGLILNMIAGEKYFSIDILQSFESGVFIDGFIETLDKTQMEYTAEKHIPFETTKDKALLLPEGRWRSFYCHRKPTQFHSFRCNLTIKSTCFIACVFLWKRRTKL